MKKRQAFTLIELIVAVSLLSILLTLIMPSTNIYSRYNENSEINTLFRDLNTTRTKAVSKGVAYTFHVDTDGAGYYIKSNEDVVRRVGLNFIEITTSHNLKFYPSGSSSESETMKIRKSNKKIIYITIAVGTAKITLKED